MSIKALYRDYFQKSKVFMYPALDIKKGSSVIPLQTYIAWKDHYLPEDRKLMCVYYLRDDSDFRGFEKIKLLGNPLFHDFKILDNNKGVYIFDFESYKTDWDLFLEGKYSQMSFEIKKKIKQFYSTNNTNYVYVESYLHPEKYFHMYSQLLGVHVNVLKETGELCEHYDPEKEFLIADIKQLDIRQKIS